MLALPFLAAASQAQVFPSFEAVMVETRRQILQVRNEQVQAKDLQLAQDINRSSREANSLAMDAWRLRSQISDVRRRAQSAQDNPNQPGHDPFLRNEIQRLVWDLRDFSRSANDIYRDIQRISRSIQQKDPDLVQPARSLVSSTQRLNSEAGWVRNEANWASMDIRRAGFSMEAWDVERESSDAENSSRQAHSEAQRLLGQVQ
ncbi:MAG: hypothetical protein HY922_03985 [Elusimicrobia bacterium]|nr:hypothetical protein [Elusimicrobiota bacterium]